ENEITGSSQQGLHLFHHSDNTRIFKNHIQSTWFGIQIEAAGKNISIFDNVIENNQIYGIFSTSTDVTISHNNCTNNGEAGITIRGNTPSRVVNNQIRANDEYGFLGGLTDNMNNCVIENNIISENGDDGIFLPGGAYYNTILSNLIYNNSGMGILMREASFNQILYNSIVENADRGIWMRTSANQNNFIQCNDFVSNGGGSAEDDEGNNIFAYNYYHPWSSTDLNGDEIVDLPHIIPGERYNQDGTPRVYPNNELTNQYLDPYLTQTRLTYPVGGETLTESVVLIQWKPAKHSYGQNVTYFLQYSPNRGISWNILAENVTDTRFAWNVSTLSTGYWYYIQVLATAPDGLAVFDENPLLFGIINEHIPYTLSKPQILPLSGNPTLFATPFLSLEWTEAVDSCGFPVTYAIYSSTDDGASWILLRDDLFDNSYLCNLIENLPPQEEWPTIRSYHLKVKASSNGDQLTAEDIIEIPVIPYNGNTTLSSSQPTSVSNSPINLLPLVQIAGLGGIIFFIATLVLVIRRQQLTE
ncbi:MAG: right-handed parallel beta-helix repeat-containing protein, partial [Candidatus Hodarchaeales archaeon]